jgi:hypothetical protein
MTTTMKKMKKRMGSQHSKDWHEALGYWWGAHNISRLSRIALKELYKRNDSHRIDAYRYAALESCFKLHLEFTRAAMQKARKKMREEEVSE